MSAYLAVLLLAATPAVDEAYDTARALMDEGAYGESWEALQTVDDPLLRHRGEVDLFYRTRDFAASLATARRGLELFPEDLFLLHRAVSAAIWLRDVESSLALSERLGRAVQRTELSEAERAAWAADATDFERRARRLEQAASRRDTALARARWVSLALLAASGLGIVGLALKK